MYFSSGYYLQVNILQNKKHTHSSNEIKGWLKGCCVGCACDGRIHCACSRCAAKHCMAVIQLAYFYESQGMKKISPNMLHIYISCKLFSANVIELLFISSSFHYSFSVIVLAVTLPTYLLTLMFWCNSFIRQVRKHTHKQRYSGAQAWLHYASLKWLCSILCTGIGYEAVPCTLNDMKSSGSRAVFQRQRLMLLLTYGDYLIGPFFFFCAASQRF